MARKADLLIRRIGALATPCGKVPLAGSRAGAIDVAANRAVAVENGRIAGVWPDGKVPKGMSARSEVDAGGRLATPGFVDPHTHLVFAGSRHDEYDMRIRGASYLEIAGRGGGIRSTVAAVRAAGDAALAASARDRLARMRRDGTCVVEVKSGYGLATAAETRILEVVRALDGEGGMKVVPTFLGAHALPAEFGKDRQGYVDLVVREMLPAVARGRLAAFCDVFCESGAFTADESRTILAEAARLGLGLKLHAEQFTHSGGARLAGELKAASADHLGCATAEDAAFLAKQGVVAVLLPGSALTVGTPPFRYARLLIDGGAPVAIATDCNPGTSFLDSMPLAWSLACSLYRMTPAEGLVAATLNAACALGLGATAGSLEKGKRADLVLWDAEDIREIPYRFGRVPIREVFCGGKPVSGDHEPVTRQAGRSTGTLRAWIDGASRGNPGPASTGVVIEGEDGRVLVDEGTRIGETTNNVAEYRALLSALAHGERLGASIVEVMSDSELLVKQINGEYRVKHPNMKPLHAEALERMGRFSRVAVRHVRREQNTRADAAANRALDSEP